MLCVASLALLLLYQAQLDQLFRMSPLIQACFQGIVSIQYCESRLSVVQFSQFQSLYEGYTLASGAAFGFGAFALLFFSLGHKRPRLNVWTTRVFKALFFFSLGIYVIEAWIFDMNPSRIKVAGTPFSISFYEYITASDLARYFWAGILILAIGAVVFAFSKYWYLLTLVPAFAAAFYYQIVASIPLMNYYQNTYACHEIFSSTGDYRGNVCPLLDMTRGHPTIPLQGNVLGPLAFAIALVSLVVWRSNSGLKIALLETVIFGSGTILVFELGIYYFQRMWYNQRVLDYQGLLHLGGLTNKELLIVSGVLFMIILVCRLELAQRKKIVLENPSVDLTVPA
jgi:hypothetical protein